MNKKLEILRIINNMMLPFVIATVLFVAVGMEADGVLFAGNFLLVLFVVISEAAQYVFSGFATFLLSHLFGICLCTFMSIASGNQPVGYTAVRIIFMIVMTVIAIYAKMGRGIYFYPSISEAVLFILLMIACKLTKSEAAEPVVLLGEILWGILAVIFYNTRQTASALAVFKNRAKVPYESIMETNRFMMNIYLALAIVMMLICTLLDYGRQILDFLGSILVRFFRWFFSHFDFTTEEEYVQPEMLSEGGPAGVLIPEDYEDNSFIHMLWNILFWVVAAVVFAAIFYGLIKLIIFFVKRFNGKGIGIRDRLSRDNVEYLNPLSEESRPGNREGNKMSMGLRLSPRGRIRQMYKKYIRQGQGFEYVNMSQTPTEQERAAYSDKEGKKLMVELYEKARYSRQEILPEDVKKMKSMSR